MLLLHGTLSQISDIRQKMYKPWVSVSTLTRFQYWLWRSQSRLYHWSNYIYLSTVQRALAVSRKECVFYSDATLEKNTTNGNTFFGWQFFGMQTISFEDIFANCSDLSTTREEVHPLQTEFACEACLYPNFQWRERANRWSSKRRHSHCTLSRTRWFHKATIINSVKQK